MIQATAERPRQMLPRFRKSIDSSKLRREVENLLRDVAFVLKQTQRVREDIINDQAQRQTANM